MKLKINPYLSQNDPKWKLLWNRTESFMAERTRDLCPVRIVSMWTNKLKVVWSIVVSYAILMMDAFIRVKESSKHILHHESMLSNISILPSIRMRGSFDKNISRGVFKSSPLPKILIPLP